MSRPSRTRELKHRSEAKEGVGSVKSMKRYISDLNTDYDSFNAIAQCYHELIDGVCCNENHELSIDMPNWTDGNLLSVLGAIFTIAKANGRDVRINCTTQGSKNYLCRMRFLAFPQGLQELYPLKSTMIPYTKFNSWDISGISGFLAQYLPVNAFPKMSEKAWERLTQSISEVCMNAFQHSTSPYLFICGQHFPHKKRLDITMTDIGIGMKEPLLNNRGMDLSDVDAIEWSVQPGHTTKLNEPGGAGLAELIEFIRLNDGRLQIISKSGYYEDGGDGKIKDTLSFPFPGTIFNLEVNTEDEKSYRLVSEI